MKPLALALLAILVVVALRRREPDRAVAPLRHRHTLDCWEPNACPDPTADLRSFIGAAPHLLADAETAACPACDGEGLIQCHDFIGCLHGPHYDGYHLCVRCDGSGLQPSDLYPTSLLR